MSSRGSMLLVGVVTAISLSGCDSGSSGDVTGTGTESGGATTVSVGPPSDLEAKAILATVRLRWSPPAEGPSVEGYGIYRKGSLLQGVTGGQTTFTDDEVKPGKTYTYEVRARAGGAVSEPASVEVDVPVPPLKAARLIGRFAVTSRVITQSGYRELSAPSFSWHFTAKCDLGPCDVDWRDTSYDRVHARLHRRGNRYVGQYSGIFTTECYGTRTHASLELSLYVAKARAMGGQWRATRLNGSMKASQSAQLGCRAASFELAVTGRWRIS